MKIDKLLESDPFEFSKRTNKLFFESLRETAIGHYERNAFIKFLWDKNSIHPSSINDSTDLTLLPFTVVNLFKYQNMLSKNVDDIVLTLGSSGTGGQRSQIHLDQGSLDRVKKLAFNIHESLGISSKKKYNYVCFTYDPAIANDLGTAFTDELLTNFTQKNEVFYTFQMRDGEFFFNEEQTVEKLKEFEKAKLPTRILGFPAFLYQIINKYDLELNLGEDSWVQTGGGWKGLADEEIPKGEFREFISRKLGLPRENIRDLFGMVEHGIPYVDCPKGHLRIPNYARVLIRDPKDLRVLRYGEIGLIQFICSYNTSYPAFNLLSTDWGYIEKSQDNFGDILVLTGRAGVNKNKGCALKAAQLMK